MSTIIRRPTGSVLRGWVYAEYLMNIYIGSKDVSASSDASDNLLARGTGRLWREKKKRNALQCNDKDMQLLFMIHFSTTLPHEEIPKGLSTWRREDPCTRKILERETTFRSIYMQKFRSVWLTVEKGIKIKDYPLNESPPFCSVCL